MTDGRDFTHGTSLVLREAGVLVRGASGAGKSRLALLLIAEAERQRMFARLVGDDRVQLIAWSGRLIARGHPTIAGQVERRGVGIVSVPHEQACVVRTVIDLEVEDLPRWPADAPREVTIDGVALPNLVLRAGLQGVDIPETLGRVVATTRWPCAPISLA